MTLAIPVHLIAAVLAVVLGTVNIISEKGARWHRMIGWAWLTVMLGVTVPSIWIREINDGRPSWIHGLTIWTLVSRAMAIWAIRTGRIRTHANFMIGTMIGVVIAGFFAVLPGRCLSRLFGY